MTSDASGAGATTPEALRLVGALMRTALSVMRARRVGAAASQSAEAEAALGDVFSHVGTHVILDTYELALVHTANSNPSFMHRPVVRLLCEANGLWLEPQPLVDLAQTDGDGGFARSIIEVTSTDRYGIKVSDYFV